MPKQDKKYKGKCFRLTYEPAPTTEPILKTSPCKVSHPIISSKIEVSSERLIVTILFEEQIVFRNTSFYTHEKIIPSIISLRPEHPHYISFAPKYEPIEIYSKKVDDLIDIKIIRSNNYDSETKRFINYRSRFFWLTYPTIFKHLLEVFNILKEKLIRHDHKATINNYCLTNEVSFILKHDHCHIYLELTERISFEITDPRFFDIIHPDTGVLIHPNVIGRMSLHKNIFKISYLYQSKTGVKPLTNATEEQIEEWLSTVDDITEIKLYSLNAQQIREAYESYIKDPHSAEKKYSQKQITDLIKAAEKLKRIIKTPPSTIPKEINIIENWNEQNQSKILTVFTNSMKKVLDYRKFLYDYYQGTLDLTQEDTLKYLPDRIHDFNKSNVNPFVNRILIKLVHLNDPSFPDLLQKIKNNSLILKKKVSSKELKFDPNLNFIVISDHLPSKLDYLDIPQIIKLSLWTVFINGFEVELKSGETLTCNPKSIPFKTDSPLTRGTLNGKLQSLFL